MSTQALIDTAVVNSTTVGRKSWADKLFIHWFNRLVYAQIWEDPVADLAALRIQPGEHMLTISSGGCNALAYLTAQPGAVHAVDLNEAHLATLEIKRAAFRALPSYDDLLAFLGEAAAKENTARYEKWIAPQLQAEAREWWETADVLGRPRHSFFTRYFYRRGLLGEFIGLSHLFVRLLGGNLAKLGAGATAEERQALFDRHLAPVFRNPLVRFLANRPTALYSLGIPPAQFEAIRRDATQGVSADFSDRMRRLTCDWPLEENCFAMQAVRRGYDIECQSSLPMYLQREHYATIRQELDNLHSHHITLTEFLRGQARESLDAYVFLDAQDWMDRAQITELWDEVTRTARPGARVLFRTGGATSPLEAQLPTELLAHWHTDVARNRALHTCDRSAIYGGMHLYEKRA